MIWLLFAAMLSLMIEAAGAANGHPVVFTIDMTGPSTDTFLVEVKPPRLREENNIYQFASTAPGAYQVMDIGRFVSHFKAFDKKGREIPVVKIGVNQYEVTRPKNVYRMTYQVAETWDTPVMENPVYQMSGSSLEKDHALINVHTLLGYFHGMQQSEMEIGLVYPAQWSVGTALPFNRQGHVIARDFDFAVDSPILLGRLTTASLDIDGRKIDIFTYSKTDMIKSVDLMQAMRSIFVATNDFVKGFPIDRYVLLFHFADISVGAWEHSYSSEYVMKEAPLSPEYAAQINSIAAHEIFHMVTPLNIHSEVIERFNFVKPTPSQHLWLYEGVTEWASDMIQLRGGLITLEEFLDQVSEKLNVNDHYDKDLSLKELALTSYTSAGAKQYINIYYRGALVPLIMDIFLLEKTHGTRGLREIILDLTKQYGPHKAFSEDGFFAEFVSMTDPGMKPIIDGYIVRAEPLPIATYFEKLGIRYRPVVVSDEMEADRGHTLTFNGNAFVISEVRERSAREGLEPNDIIGAINGIEAVPANFSEVVPLLQGIMPGDTITYEVKRGDEMIEIPLSVGERNKTEHHVFEIMPDATREELELRKVWMKKL